MDSEIIKQIRDVAESSGNKDYAIELFQEGINSLTQEIYPVINRLKEVNKDFCMDLQESQILYLHDLLALSTRYLTRNSKEAITPEQGLIIGRLIGSIEKDIEINKKEIDI
jgi:hypothetical protein